MLQSPLRSAHKQREYKKQNLYAWLFILAQAAVVVALVFVLFLSPVRVNGGSMSPTLMQDDVLLIDKLSLYLRTPARGDVVIFSHAGTGEELIKRVIALPGETVEITGGSVYVDGRLLDESAYAPAAAADYPATYVEAGHVFVLGDDRGQSLDSRELGCIPMQSLDGRVRFRVAPFARAALFL